jgi:hypothetical protein
VAASCSSNLLLKAAESWTKSKCPIVQLSRAEKRKNKAPSLKEHSRFSARMTQTAIATTLTPESALRCQSESSNKKTFQLTTVKTLTTWTTSSPATKSFSTVYSSPFAMCEKQLTQAQTISALIESILLTTLSTSQKNTLYRIAMTMNLSRLSKLTTSCLRGVLKA